MVDCFGRQIFESRWIPVKESIPKNEETYVILSIDNGAVFTEYWSALKCIETKKLKRYFLWEHEVLAWMPIPDFYIPPPVKEKEEKKPIEEEKFIEY